MIPSYFALQAVYSSNGKQHSNQTNRNEYCSMHRTLTVLTSTSTKIRRDDHIEGCDDQARAKDHLDCNDHT